MNWFKARARRVYLLVFLGLVLVGLISFKTVDFNTSKSLDIFFSFFREVNVFYVDKPDPEKLVLTGIQAMLESLDPYNEFIPEEELDVLEFQTTGEYGGMGALIRHNDDYPVIAEVYEGSPAYKAGLMAGDKILEINGVAVGGMVVDKVSKMLKGVPNSQLRVAVNRFGSAEPLSYTFKREKIHIPSVPYSGMISNEVGYIRLSSFTTNSDKEVEQALKELKSRGGAKGIVLDLRGNPGGLLMEAVKIVNLFIEKNQLVVYTKGQIKEFDQEYRTSSKPVDTHIPLIVLVDRASASASEIVAGALQDLDRAIVLGERTFGKGLVQATRQLPYNSQLKITTAKYYIPSGRCIQAVDFTQRNEDGSISFIPDSLIKEFKTLNGRTVRDGGGIAPDVELSASMYSRFAAVLYARNIMFDYATQFRINNPSIGFPASFSLSDSSYNHFKQYVASSGFEYQSQTELALTEMVKVAKQEKYYEVLKSLTDSLTAALQGNSINNLELFKPEVKKLLEEELVGRYYYQKGKSEFGIRNDIAIPRCIELLTNPKAYNDVLKRTSNLGEVAHYFVRDGYELGTLNQNQMAKNSNPFIASGLQRPS